MSHYFTPQSLPDNIRHAAPGEAPSNLLAAFGIQVRWITAGVHDCKLELAAEAGVFSKESLDAGSQLLIETTTLEKEARVCDLGCGWGAVGCFIASLHPTSSVWMCDINLRAVALAHFNFQHNQLSNVTAWCGNGLDAAKSASFDVVLCNPPVRAGNKVIEKLFDDAERCLSVGGSLWVVLRTAQGAKSWQRRLATQFGNCDTIKIEHGYRILKSSKQP